MPVFRAILYRHVNIRFHTPASKRICFDMAFFYTRCLQDLPCLTINDVDRLVKMSCTTPSSKREKGFKMYIASYIDDYEVSVKNKVTGEEENWPVDLTWHKIVYQEALIHHDCHVRGKKRNDSGLSEHLPVTNRPSIESRNKGYGTMGCHSS
ncbi:hypothetical protein MHYP_G00217330 [Metynnis hypsauchen]